MSPTESIVPAFESKAKAFAIAFTSTVLTLLSARLSAAARFPSRTASRVLTCVVFVDVFESVSLQFAQLKQAEHLDACGTLRLRFLGHFSVHLPQLRFSAFVGASAVIVPS